MGEINFFDAVENGNLSADYAKLKHVWKAAADAIAEQPTYYVKNAYIRFELNGNSYFISAGSLDISNEHFDYIERDIEADLKNMGANKVCYCGMID